MRRTQGQSEMDELRRGAVPGSMPQPMDDGSHMNDLDFQSMNQQRYNDLKRNPSDRMRTMFKTSMMYARFNTEAPPVQDHVNPLWMSFEGKCPTPIRGKKEMEELLRHYAKSGDVMVVRYWQDNCTACGALDKIMEFMCRGMKKRYPNLHFYDIHRESNKDLTDRLIRFPQVKAFSGGQWQDIDFKPPDDFREQAYSQVQKEVHTQRKQGNPITAVQAEEMFFSLTGPATAMLLEENLEIFYRHARVRMHNYFDQVSKRRSWYYKNFVQRPETEEPQTSGAEAFGTMSVVSPDEMKNRLHMEKLYGRKRVVHQP